MNDKLLSSIFFNQACNLFFNTYKKEYRYSVKMHINADKYTVKKNRQEIKKNIDLKRFCRLFYQFLLSWFKNKH